MQPGMAIIENAREDHVGCARFEDGARTGCACWWTPASSWPILRSSRWSRSGCHSFCPV